MKILITNNSLANFTGTESWVYAMANQLRKEHEVVVWTAQLGRMSDKLKEIGVEVTKEQPKEYDFALVNHIPFWGSVKEPKVFTTHSAYLEIEQPPAHTDYIGVNELLSERVIRNGIDLDRFKETPINKELKNIFLLSNPAYSKGYRYVKDALPEYNVYTLQDQIFNIEDEVAKADLVISFQRGAIESLAMGKNVIYADWRNDRNTFEGYGIITEQNYELFKKGEMRRLIHAIGTEELIENIKQYDPNRNLRHLIEKDFNIKLTAKQYLALAKK